MGFSTSCRCWSVLQVVTVVVCYRGKVSGITAEIAQGCVGSQLSLECPEMKVINVTAVVLGDSKCLGSRCCIKEKDCTRSANENHITDVHRGCNDKRRCIVQVLKEKIPCGFLILWSNNDFERVTYNCRDEPRKSTSATLSWADSTVGSTLHTSEQFTEDETTNDDLTLTAETNVELYNNMEAIGKSYGVQTTESSSQVLPVLIIVIICLIVVIAIVVPVSVVAGRKTAGINKNKNEESADNGAKSCETLARSNCIQEGAATGRRKASRGNAYEQCSGGTNYETLNLKMAGIKKSKNEESEDSDNLKLEGAATGRRESSCENAYEEISGGTNYEPLDFYEELP